MKFTVVAASVDWMATVSLPSRVSIRIDLTDESGPVTAWVPFPLQPAPEAPEPSAMSSPVSVNVYFPAEPVVETVRLFVLPAPAV